MAVKTAKYIFRGQEYILTKNATTGLWEATVSAPSVSSYSQPDHKFGGQLVATDDAGNSSTVDENKRNELKLQVKEKVAPVIAITYPTAAALITNSTPEIRWKVTDNDSGVADSTLSIDGKAVTTGITKTTVSGGFEYKYTPATALADGEHNISIGATDNDGNKASAKNVSFKIDTTPPSLTVDINDGYITNNPQLNVTGLTDDVTSKPVTVKVNGADATVNTDGRFNKTITLTEGANTVTTVATDKAGKSTTIVRHVTLDTAPPVFGEIKLTPNPVDCGKTFIISVKIDD